MAEYSSTGPRGLGTETHHTDTKKGNYNAREVHHPHASGRKDEEKGATAVEYGLMVALIAVAIIGTVGALGTGLDGLFTNITGSL